MNEEQKREQQKILIQRERERIKQLIKVKKHGVLQQLNQEEQFELEHNASSSNESHQNVIYLDQQVQMTESDQLNLEEIERGQIQNEEDALQQFQQPKPLFYWYYSDHWFFKGLRKQVSYVTRYRVLVFILYTLSLTLIGLHVKFLKYLPQQPYT